MSPKLFIRLIMVLAAVAALALWLNKKDDKITVEGFSAGNAVFSSLDVNSVNRIDIRSMLGTSVLARTATGWVVESMHQYPAKFDQVAGFLRKLNDMEVGQIYRGGTDDVSELGLAHELSSPDQMVITIGTASKVDAYVLFIGSLKQPREASARGMGMPQGRYIRIGEGPALLVDELFYDVPASSRDWADNQLLNIPLGDIAQYAIAGMKDEFIIRRDEDGNFMVGRLAENESVDQTSVQNALQMFGSLQFVSIANPALSDEATGLSNPEMLTATTKDGFVYKILIGAAVSNDFMRTIKINVGYQPAPEPDKSQADIAADREFKSGEGVDEAEARQKNREIKYTEMLAAYHAAQKDNETEAARRNERYQKWRYQIPASTVDQIMPVKSTLIKVAATTE